MLGSRGPRRREPEGHRYFGAHRRPAGDLRTQVDSVAAHRATIPAVIAVLRKHRTEQKAERLRAGNQWHDSGLIFTTEFGGPVDPRNLLRVIEVAAKAAGVDGIGVHTLRHSAAVAGWKPEGILRPSLICSSTPRLRLPATCTATPPTTRHGRLSTAWRRGSGCDCVATGSQIASYDATPTRVWLTIVDEVREESG